MMTFSDQTDSYTPTLTLLIPAYNEREVLPLCYQRLRAVLDSLTIDYELLFVDDGSRDGTSEYLVDLANKMPRVRTLLLSRNFGKEAAMTAGLAQARGNAVIILDADLQDPPELIPEMVQHWRAGVDIVSMRRRSRQGETWLKRASAHIFYRALRQMCRLDIPEDTGDFRLMSRRAVDALNQLPERHRYMKGLFAWIGLPTQVMLYDRAPRAAGTTKWDWFSLIGLAVEGITSFSTAPLRWASMFGFLAALVGASFGLWIVFKTLFLGGVVPGYPSLMATITFLGGVQLLTIGLVGEYVGKTYFEAKQRPVYLIQDMIENHQANLPAGSAQAVALTRNDRREIDSHAA